MPNILTVSDITAQIKGKLENEIPDALIRAEISECKYHGSGHIYLVLKDPGAVLPAVIWRTAAQQLRTRPEAGMEVIVYGRLSVYAPQGRYQFVIQTLQEAGRGELYARFEALKAKLIGEGLCDPERRKPVPKYPMHVGLVTSETGAALQDMLKVFRHDAPHVALTLAAARVQGKGAAQTVIDALEKLKISHPDCVILARGGGSIEDLWEFNDESLARYISAYPLPLISGIGHETDTSIADFVSDHRASTPTNAAEFICASWRDARNLLNQLDYTLSTRVEWHVERQRKRFENIQRYLSSRRIIDLLRSWGERIANLRMQLVKGAEHHLHYKRARYEGVEGKLFAYSPVNVLKKGYALIRDKNRRLLGSTGSLTPPQDIEIEFHDGSAAATVHSKEHKGP